MAKHLASFIIIFAVSGNFFLFGQQNKDSSKYTNNENFYELNDTLLNVRTYVSQKLTSPTLLNEGGNHLIKYRSNANTNLGIGATYGWLTINIGINFKFINKDDYEKGETKFLDLHTNGIGKSYCVDFFGQFYKGVYLLPESGSLPKGSVYPQRPDIYTQQIGLAAYFFPNWRKFSYSAAINQRDWQKKSAGSFLYGGDFFTGKIRGDSSLIPRDRRAYFANPLIDKVSFVEIAAGAGYAYTLVIKKHFFASAIGSASLSGGILRQFVGERSNNSIYFRPNFLFKPSVGFNSKRWNGSVMYFNSIVYAGDNFGYYRIHTYNLRFTLACRLFPSDKTKHLIDPLLDINPTWKREEHQ